ncbi:sigma factor [Acetivibrio clariflavus]|uniref:DNA-directed RNA polymerase specialized sigma subunit n=1 Tax=Acetivibrio clariflavus (strain DSM 19732 / NBRC 101661 / EBR45) TaxID=720554 RepID=G8LUQ8_ACECE|nr:sigma factor [Acetivibrio clariflavus]AEV67398.1 DNA-directed RNA polymerase specialized sigma subunit [Acetivibrio clariflavus DSM 19732]
MVSVGNVVNEVLVILIQEGRKDLISILWEQNKKLIAWLAGKFYVKHMDRCAAAGVEEEDLIQEGFFALLDAIKYYKAESGYKFTTYIEYPLLSKMNQLIGYRGKSDQLNDTISLEESVSTEFEDICLSDVISDPNAEFEDKIIHDDTLSKLRETLIEIIETLPEKQKNILLAELNDTSKDIIVKMYQMTDDEYNRLRGQALQNCRKPHNIQRLIEFMDPYRLGLKGTGFSVWYHSRTSSVERAVEKIMDLEAAIATALCI